MKLTDSSQLAFRKFFQKGNVLMDVNGTVFKGVMDVNFNKKSW